MLVLSRKVGQEIVLPDCGVTIGVIRVVGNRVRLGIKAPREIVVRRKEIGTLAASAAVSGNSGDPLPPCGVPTGVQQTLRTYRPRRSGS